MGLNIPIKSKDYQPTAGLTSICHPTVVKDRTASLGMM